MALDLEELSVMLRDQKDAEEKLAAAQEYKDSIDKRLAFYMQQAKDEVANPLNEEIRGYLIAINKLREILKTSNDSKQLIVIPLVATSADAGPRAALEAIKNHLCIMDVQPNAIKEFQAMMEEEIFACDAGREMRGLSYEIPFRMRQEDQDAEHCYRRIPTDTYHFNPDNAVLVVETYPYERGHYRYDIVIVLRAPAISKADYDKMIALLNRALSSEPTKPAKEIITARSHGILTDEALASIERENALRMVDTGIQDGIWGVIFNRDTAEFTVTSAFLEGIEEELTANMSLHLPFTQIWEIVTGAADEYYQKQIHAISDKKGYPSKKHLIGIDMDAMAATIIEKPDDIPMYHYIVVVRFTGTCQITIVRRT